MQFGHLKRREFITLLGGTAAWPLAARAQQPKPPTIGYLGATTAAAEKSRTGSFVERLRELVAAFEIRLAEDIAPVFDIMRKDGAEALYLVGDTLLNSNRARIGASAINTRLPTICNSREYVEAGVLMSYGANIPHLFSRAAELVDKILRGAKPGDIPVEQPTKFELVVNLKTAKALGLDVPWFLQQRADEVIE
jgi:putative ABC transport system substrate-binding protein